MDATYAGITRNQRAINTDDSKPVAPEKPLPTDCCGAGCAVCVFDAYSDALTRYKAALRDWEQRQQERSGQRPDSD